MKLINIKHILPTAAFAVATMGLTACVGDLDVENINPQKVSVNNPDAAFTKIYANMVLTGQTGPAGDGDIDDIDEGTSSMIRQLWNANELPTDEAHCIWGDAGIPEFNHNAWSDSHPMMKALYYRLYFGITLANSFLEQKVEDANETLLTQRAEARFLRALYYSYLMDLYGNIPFITTITEKPAPQAKRAEVYDFVQKELLDIVGEGEGKDILKDPSQRVAYGRADKAAAWLLLSRNYLNAEVYAGKADWANAQKYAQKVVDDGTYALCTTSQYKSYSPYQLLFMGDNDKNGAQKEIILPAIHDGIDTQTWGGCLFIMASTCNDKIKESYPYGTSENWGGNHVRPQFVEKFFPSGGYATGNPTAVAASAKDNRALFFNQGHTFNIEKESDFTKGFAYVKFLNTRADGSSPKHTQFVDTDFPIFRAAEAYLNIAEADARMHGGKCTAAGLKMLNAIRSRAKAADMKAADLDVICDEWSREFGFEGRRRMDLIRFGKFGGQSKYKWQWMGGTFYGTQFDKHLNIYPIPNSDLNANGNLKQNPDYGK